MIKRYWRKCKACGKDIFIEQTSSQDLMYPTKKCEGDHLGYTSCWYCFDCFKILLKKRKDLIDEKMYLIQKEENTQELLGNSGKSH